MPHNQTDVGKKRLGQFILESIRLDALLDARERDIEFTKSGGELLYTPDSSTWNSFFFPVRYGQEHPGKNTNIPGFSEVYLESDRTDTPYFQESPLSGRQVSGMLGKVLIDAIFLSQNNNGLSTQFFLTEESKQGLNEAIKTVLLRKANKTKNINQQKTIVTQLTKLSAAFLAVASAENTEALFLSVPKNLNSAGAIESFLDDDNIINLIDRIRSYDDVSFFDWDYIKSMADNSRSDETIFQLGISDVREFERLRSEFAKTFQSALPSSAASKIASMSEILALNYIVGRSSEKEKRIIYLTNAQWAIRDFDRFVWDEHSANPLRLESPRNGLRTVSSHFVRNPLCFLHDIELRPEDGEAQGALKIFMDSVVPRKLHDDRRLDPSQKKLDLISQALDGLEKSGKLDAYVAELDRFYGRWAEKKTPWVNSFLEQRAKHWAEGLQLFSQEGFHSFWRKVNRDFTRLSWQFGIYLALMTEGRPARAAPLVFIDCDINTNALLSSMQSVLAQGDIEGFQDQIDKFLNRITLGSKERKEYFDALVNAVLFLFSSQFETSKLHAETACELAMKSRDTDVNGREAYYLRSYLVRVTAENRSDLEDARRLMLIARNKLELDNSVLPESSRISTIRFDLEDWSRRIVAALADYFDQGKPSEFPARYLREYLVFVRQATSTKFAELSHAESNALHRQICERMRFNFLVISVTMDEVSAGSDGASKGFLNGVVSEWNKVFGSLNNDLFIQINEEMLQNASIIEQAYLLSLAIGAAGADFIKIDKKINISERANQFFESNKKDVVSAQTSFVDKERYKRLGSYCKRRLPDGIVP